MLIAVEGTKTPAGEASKARPRRHEVSRRLGSRPRIAKCLERKSTIKFNRAKRLNNLIMNTLYCKEILLTNNYMKAIITFVALG